MSKTRCKRCNTRNARFDKKRQRYSSCSTCLQRVKSQKKIDSKSKTEGKSPDQLTTQEAKYPKINELYRRKLRLLFLSELRKVKPILFREVEIKLAEKYKNEFGTDLGDLQDVVSDNDYAKTFTKDFCEFAQLFVNWLDKWILEDSWIAEFFLNQLSRKDFVNFRPNLPAQIYLMPSKFEFEFPGIDSDFETEKEYRERFDKAFKEARKKHFDSIKNAKSDFINFAVKEKHIKWLIDYHFEKKNFESIAKMEQLNYRGVSVEAVRKAVNQIAHEIPLTITK